MCPTLAAGSSGSPGIRGPPRSSVGSSGSPPGTPVLALGLNARLRTADSTIWAGRLRWAGLQAVGSSCCRWLFSCSSSLELLETERPSAPQGGASRQAGGSRGSRRPGAWRKHLEVAPGLTAQGEDRDGPNQATYEHGSGKKVRQKAGLERQGLSAGLASSCGMRECLGEWRPALHAPRPSHSPQFSQASTLTHFPPGTEWQQQRKSPITATSWRIPTVRSTRRGKRHLPGLAARVGVAGGAQGPAACARG